jgi:anti-sigma factor RsiW
MQVDSNENLCAEREQIAAYLDGELDAAANASFERHLKTCADCATELAAQRRLLCVLDAAIRAEQRELALPRDFARVVTARAQTDMRGLRNRREHRLALFISGALALVVFALVGITAFDGALAALTTFARAAFNLTAFIGQAVLNICAGVSVVLRVIGGYVLTSTRAHSFIALLFFIAAVTALLRLIVRYHHSIDQSPSESV